MRRATGSGSSSRSASDIDGEGPTLYTEFEEFGKHFLRSGDPEGSSEGWQRRSGRCGTASYARQGFSNDLDEFPLDYVRYYRTIVVRRSPVASRPPANYRLTFSGRYYDVWQRDPESERSVVEQCPSGAGSSAAAGRRAARSVGWPAKHEARGPACLLAGAEVLPHPPDSVPLPAGVVSSTLRRASSSARVVPARWRTRRSSRQPGTYDLWIEGLLRARLRRLAGREPSRAHWAPPERTRSVRLRRRRPSSTAGDTSVTLFRGGGSLRAGRRAVLEMLGPILLTRHLRDPFEVPACQARRRLFTLRPLARLG